MKRVVIHQPDFIPYLGFFHRLVNAQVLILLDDAQFQKGGWNHRDKIKTPGGSKWITLPIQRGSLSRPIQEVRLRCEQPDWHAGNLNLLRENYRRTPYFAEHFKAVEEIYHAPHERLTEINYAFLRWLMDQFKVAPQVLWASELKIEGRATERLVDLVRAVEGTHYLSGTGALDYQQPELFDNAGLTLEIQQFEHPSYPQQHGEFLPYLTSLDALFNCGPTSSDLIR